MAADLTPAGTAAEKTLRRMDDETGGSVNTREGKKFVVVTPGLNVTFELERATAVEIPRLTIQNLGNQD